MKNLFLILCSGLGLLILLAFVRTLNPESAPATVEERPIVIMSSSTSHASHSSHTSAVEVHTTTTDQDLVAPPTNPVIPESDPSTLAPKKKKKRSASPTPILVVPPVIEAVKSSPAAVVVPPSETASMTRPPSSSRSLIPPTPSKTVPPSDSPTRPPSPSTSAPVQVPPSPAGAVAPDRPKYVPSPSPASFMSEGGDEEAIAKAKIPTDWLKSHSLAPDFKITRDECLPLLALRRPSNTALWRGPPSEKRRREFIRIRCVMAYGSIIDTAKGDRFSSSDKVMLTFESGDRAVLKRVTWTLPNGQPATMFPGQIGVQGWSDYASYFAIHAFGFDYLKIPIVGRRLTDEELRLLRPDWAESHRNLTAEIIFFDHSLRCAPMEGEFFSPYGGRMHQNMTAFKPLVEIKDMTVPEKDRVYWGRHMVNLLLTYLLDDEDAMNPANLCGFVRETNDPVVQANGGLQPEYNIGPFLIDHVLLDQGLTWRTATAVVKDTMVRNVPESFESAILSHRTEHLGFPPLYRCPFFLYSTDCDSVPRYFLGQHVHRRHCLPNDIEMQKCILGTDLYVCRFPRSAVDMIRDTQLHFQSRLTELLKNDPAYPTLPILLERRGYDFSDVIQLNEEYMTKMINVRIKSVLEYVDRCISTYGENAVYQLEETPYVTGREFPSTTSFFKTKV